MLRTVTSSTRQRITSAKNCQNPGAAEKIGVVNQFLQIEGLQVGNHPVGLETLQKFRE